MAKVINRFENRKSVSPHSGGLLFKKMAPVVDGMKKYIIFAL